jgi:hypothetical protein
MDNDESRERSRQLAREDQETVRPADLKVPLSDETGNDYQPLWCQVCKKVDLLETGWGNFVWAENTNRSAPPRYVDFYWVCKGLCDKFVQAELRVLKYWYPWKGLDELTNPLEYARWVKVTSHLIDRGEYSETAAAKIEDLKRIIGPIADREPTAKDVERYHMIIMVDNL